MRAIKTAANFGDSITPFRCAAAGLGGGVGLPRSSFPSNSASNWAHWITAMIFICSSSESCSNPGGNGILEKDEDFGIDGGVEIDVPERPMEE